jgi:hypothetical protein
MGEYLQSLFSQDWRPTSRYSLVAWLVFYIGFLIYAFGKHGEFLFIDLANLVVHEGGHLLFGWFGSTLGLWGGTILQWLAPLLLAGYFFTQRQTSAFAFCTVSFSKTGYIPRPIWRMPAPCFFRWSPPETPITSNTIGIRFFPAWVCSPTTRKSPQW